MLQPGAALTAFRAATNAFLATVREIREWDVPSGVGEWTVRELAGHTLRAYSTVETYLAAESPGRPPIDSATEYYRQALPADASQVIHEGVAARGREAGAALSDPQVQIEQTLARVLDRVTSLPEDTTVNVFTGPMPLSEYVATRTVEVTVHTLDLRRAAGLPAEMPDVAVRLCLDLLIPLADPVQLLLGITGRGSVNVLG